MASFVKSKHTQHHQHRPKYKPMLCSLSNHDRVIQPLSARRHSTSSSLSTSTSSSDDPSSPRVGCMGQVKMKNSPVGFPAPISTTDNTSNISRNNNQNEHHSNNHCNSTGMVKYLNFRLKGFFSRRSLTSYPGSTIRAAVAGTHKTKININKESQMESHHPRPRNSTGSRVALCRSSIDKNRSNNEKGYCMVNLKEMDPPLPVVKRVPRQQYKEESSSLWKRRSGGIPLKSIDVMIQ